MNEFLQAISQVGFPIVVAMYSLVRLEKTVKENTLIMSKIYERMLSDENKKE